MQPNVLPQYTRALFVYQYNPTLSVPRLILDYLKVLYLR